VKSDVFFSAAAAPNKFAEIWCDLYVD
jgi:hypothetical protein